ncbi:MAG: hypothetical protein LC118_20895, partial [Dehalococcoidia bacterium]|nr:hypothetical protein [Dehalococcoidia bacterium]
PRKPPVGVLPPIVARGAGKWVAAEWLVVTGAWQNAIAGPDCRLRLARRPGAAGTGNRPLSEASARPN